MGPESTTALMTAVAIGPLAGGQPTRYAALASTLALLVGLLAILAGLGRLGFVADLLSRPVVVGYLAGLALVMIAGQLARITGTPAGAGRTFVSQVSWFAAHAGSTSAADVAIAAVVLAFLLLAQWRWPSLPGPLIAVLAATAVVWAAGLASRGAGGVAVVGQVPAGLPPPRLPRLQSDELRQLAGPAVAVLVVAFSDDVLTARGFARRGERIRGNNELLALGLANALASVFRGFPVSSSASRTAIGQAAGARTQVYSVTAAAVTLAALAAARSVIARFPEAALGAIVIYAAVRLIDVDAFRRLVAYRRRELIIAVAATAGVLVFNILIGVLIAVGLSVAELLTRVARPHDAILGQVPGLAGMHNVDDYPTARTTPGLVVYRYDAPLFFANAENFRERAVAAAESDPALRWFVLNMEANVEVDFTALEAVESVRADLARRGVVFALARVKQDLLAQLRSFGLAAKVGDSFIFPTLPTALDGYRRWVERHPPELKSSLGLGQRSASSSARRTRRVAHRCASRALRGATIITP